MSVLRDVVLVGSGQTSKMALNIERIRKQVQKAIQVAPFQVEMKRAQYKSDGRGGRIREKDDETSFKGTCLFDNSGDGPFNISHSEAGRAHEQSGPYLIIVYENSNQVKEGDYFEYAGSRYEVTKATNVLALNIYWQVRLKEIKL